MENEQRDAVESSHASAWTRVLSAFIAGVVAFGIAMLATPWQVAALIGWSVTAIAFLVWVWGTIAGKDGDTTAGLATAKDQSSLGADRLVIGASGASLIGVALALLEASGESGAAKALITAVAGLSIVLAWVAVNTVYTLRYAHLYYRDGGGISFNEARAPDYGDFAYLAFTIGMTYQVSDTLLSAKSIRMTALRHAFLSFLFVTSVLAMAINVVSGLFTD